MRPSRELALRLTLAAAGACLIGGCGAGVAAPDLFLVTRSGPGSTSTLTMVVNEEGGVRCNGARAGMLSDPQIIEARTITEDLHGPVTHHVSLGPRPGSVYSYHVRDAEGQLAFADNSAALPKVLEQLQGFVATVAQGLCH
ncbi:MAG: hypothetical protein ACYDA6_10485, partial [Solirubrobacteraceae bacterium]